jgi:hypothetical protein
VRKECLFQGKLELFFECGIRALLNSLEIHGNLCWLLGGLRGDLLSLLYNRDI